MPHGAVRAGADHRAVSSRMTPAGESGVAAAPGSNVDVEVVSIVVVVDVVVVVDAVTVVVVVGVIEDTVGVIIVGVVCARESRTVLLPPSDPGQVRFGAEPWTVFEVWLSRSRFEP